MGELKRVKFRIEVLMAEKEISIKHLYERVAALGCDVSSSHFYRQMKPYYSPIRTDVLAYVAAALDLKASELFEFVDLKPGSSKKDLNDREVMVDEEADQQELTNARSKARDDLASKVLGASMQLVKK